MTPDIITESSRPLPKILEKAAITVCVGAGGVGKTTLAAAAGIAYARQGKRTIVITIDPARRLADAIGLGEMSDELKPIDGEILQKIGVDIKKGGSLSAIMLDVDKGWNDIIERYAQSEEQKQAIYSNPFYKRLTSSLAGGQEYMALEKLYELSSREDVDAIVLDTPPSIHALDFLDAPQKLVDLLNSQAVKLFTLPYKLGGKAGFRVMEFTNTIIMKRLAEFTGTELLKSLAEFMVAFEGMYEGFKERAEQVAATMRSPETVYLIVCSPTEGATEQAQKFYAEIVSRKMNFGAFIVNQMHPKSSLIADEETKNRLREEFLYKAKQCGFDEACWELLWKNACYSESLWRRDLERAADLRKFKAAKGRLVGIPRYPEGIVGIEMLAELSSRLWDAEEI